MRDRIAILLSLFLSAGVMWSQQQAPASAPANSQQSMPGMDMSTHDMSNMKGMSMGADKGDGDSDAGAHAMHSMEGHMDMGPHMKMTALRQPKPPSGRSRLWKARAKLQRSISTTTWL